MKELYSHSIIYFFAKVVPALASLVGISLYIRLLGKSSYGDFAVIISNILLIQAFFSTWIAQSVLRFRTEYEEDGHCSEFYEAVYRSSGIALVCIFSVGALTVLYVGPWLYGQVILSSLVVAFYVLYSVESVIISSRMESRKILISESIRSVAILISSILTIYFLNMSGPNSLLLGLLIGIVVGYLVLRRGRGPWRASPDRTKKVRTIIIRFLKYGMPLSLWMAVMQMHNVSDRVQISYFCGNEATAEFSAVYDIVYKFYGFALIPVLSAAHPMIMNSWNSGREIDATSTVINSLRLQLLISVSALTILWLFKGLLVRMLLGEANQAAERLIFPVAIGAIVWQFSMLLHKLLEVKGEVLTMVRMIIVSLFVNVSGNFVLIPIVGYVAAAYTTLMSGIVYLLLVLISIRKKS